MMRVKKTISVTLILLGVVLVVSALPLAIKFFFRIFQLFLLNPLEGLCMTGLLLVFQLLYIAIVEGEEG